MAYEIGINGERNELFFSESDLISFLNPECVLLLIKEDLRRIFIWNGIKSPVKKKFISAQVARDLQQELMKNVQYSLCKIISVDQGDEVQEFLDAFNLDPLELKEKLLKLGNITETKTIPHKKRRIHPLKRLTNELASTIVSRNSEILGEKEYRISEFITLKLIKGQTVIFIDDKPFHQCKYLLLNLTQNDFTEFEEIDSIDDAFKLYNKLDKKHEKEQDLIDPESEFMGHCSNLQAWYEHDYDPRILHSSLSIPLLKKLAFLGDKRAIFQLKEIIGNRIASRNHNTILFYLNEKYFKLFSNDELEVIFDEWLEDDVKFSLMEKRRLWYPLLKELIERGISRAKIIMKHEIISYLEEDNFEAYRFLLQNDYFNLLELEDLEELYELIPKKDLVAIRRIESLILKATLKRRRNNEN